MIKCVPPPIDKNLTSHDLEAFVAAFFSAFGFYVEKNLLFSNECRPGEIDLVITKANDAYGNGWPLRGYGVECKGGTIEKKKIDKLIDSTNKMHLPLAALVAKVKHINTYARRLESQGLLKIIELEKLLSHFFSCSERTRKRITHNFLSFYFQKYITNWMILHKYYDSPEKHSEAFKTVTKPFDKLRRIWLSKDFYQRALALNELRKTTHGLAKKVAGKLGYCKRTRDADLEPLTWSARFISTNIHLMLCANIVHSVIFENRSIADFKCKAFHGVDINYLIWESNKYKHNLVLIPYVIQNWLYFWGGFYLKSENLEELLSEDIGAETNDILHCMKTYKEAFGINFSGGKFAWQMKPIFNGEYVDILPLPFRFIGAMKRFQVNGKVDSRILKRWSKDAKRMFRHG